MPLLILAFFALQLDRGNMYEDYPSMIEVNCNHI